jgi:anion-transporting  ArsA/GET3 family ATPase
MAPSLTASRVVVVSGKGGVGKTTVAAALALAAARAGKHVLLAELEDRQAFAPLFGAPEVGPTPKTLAPNITGVSIEPDEALVEYLRVAYGIPKISRALIRSRAIEFATHTAPGLKDILLIGTVKQAEGEQRSGAPLYDLIVVDAPPTGRLPRFLDAPRAVAELVQGGPIRRQAEGVQGWVLDPAKLQVVLVTHAEEMPVRETSEAIEVVQKMGIELGPVVVNGVWPDIKGLGRDARATLASNATDASLELSDAALDALADVASVQARRSHHQRKALKQLDRDVALPQACLPYLFTARMDREELTTLSHELEGSGLL